MADSFPSISADQLTKAVSIAAAGTLCDLENSEDGWNSESVKVLPVQNMPEDGQEDTSCLKLLESLSSSLSSSLSPGLQKLNELSAGGTSIIPPLEPQANGTVVTSSVTGRANYNLNKKKKPGAGAKPAPKKFCSRKNYKLQPPLLPSQIRAMVRKSPPDVEVQQLVTPDKRSESKPVLLPHTGHAPGYVLVNTTIPPQALSQPENRPYIQLSPQLKTTDASSMETGVSNGAIQGSLKSAVDREASSVTHQNTRASSQITMSAVPNETVPSVLISQSVARISDPSTDGPKPCSSNVHSNLRTMVYSPFAVRPAGQPHNIGVQSVPGSVRVPGMKNNVPGHLLPLPVAVVVAPNAQSANGEGTTGTSGREQPCQAVVAIVDRSIDPHSNYVTEKGNKTVTVIPKARPLLLPKLPNSFPQGDALLQNLTQAPYHFNGTSFIPDPALPAMTNPAQDSKTQTPTSGNSPLMPPPNPSRVSLNSGNIQPAPSATPCVVSLNSGNTPLAPPTSPCIVSLNSGNSPLPPPASPCIVSLNSGNSPLAPPASPCIVFLTSQNSPSAPPASPCVVSLDLGNSPNAPPAGNTPFTTPNGPCIVAVSSGSSPIVPSASPFVVSFPLTVDTQNTPPSNAIASCPSQSTCNVTASPSAALSFPNYTTPLPLNGRSRSEGTTSVHVAGSVFNSRQPMLQGHASHGSHSIFTPSASPTKSICQVPALVLESGVKVLQQVSSSQMLPQSPFYNSAFARTEKETVEHNVRESTDESKDSPLHHASASTKMSHFAPSPVAVLFSAPMSGSVVKETSLKSSEVIMQELDPAGSNNNNNRSNCAMDVTPKTVSLTEGCSYLSNEGLIRPNIVKLAPSSGGQPGSTPTSLIMVNSFTSLTSAPRMSFTVVPSPFQQQQQSQALSGQAVIKHPNLARSITNSSSGVSQATVPSQLHAGDCKSTVMSTQLAPTTSVSLTVSADVCVNKNEPFDSWSTKEMQVTTTQQERTSNCNSVKNETACAILKLSQVSPLTSCSTSAAQTTNTELSLVQQANIGSVMSTATFTNTSDSCTSGPPTLKGVSSLQCLPTVRPSTSKMLIPSKDSSKLVLSAAGIRHLQALMRSRGTTEGYFVITSPRGIRQHSPTVTADCSSTSNGKMDQVKENCSSHTSCSDGRKSKVCTETLDVSKSLVSRPQSVSGTGQIIRFDSIKNESKSPAEDSDNESVVSSGSRSTSSALVIETGEDCDMDAESDTGPLSELTTCTSVKDPVAFTSEEPVNLSKHSEEGLMHNTALTKPTEALSLSDTEQQMEMNRGQNSYSSHSPLSLSDLVHQQHGKVDCRIQESVQDYRSHQLPQNCSKDVVDLLKDKEAPVSTVERTDFTFPVPACPTTPVSHSHHSSLETDLQHNFSHSLYTPQSLYPEELRYDAQLPNPSHCQPMDSQCSLSGSHMEEQQIVVTSDNSPGNVTSSTAVDVVSPKSPLLVSSSHAADNSINPPMTPNTMLINLLNRVPTPLLTNHQDLLTAPTANAEQDQETENVASHQMNNHSGGLSFSGKMLPVERVNDGPAVSLSNNPSLASSVATFPAPIKVLSSDAAHYTQTPSGLDLIACNYSSHHQQNSSLNEQTSSNALNFTLSNETSEGKTLSPPHHNTDSTPSAMAHSGCLHSYHCKTCSVPLTVTVNLDSSHTEEMVPEERKMAGEVHASVLATYEHGDQRNGQVQLGDHVHDAFQVNSCVPPSSHLSKSGDDSVVSGHVNLSSNSSAFQTLSQSVDEVGHQSFDIGDVNFDLSTGNHRQPHFDCHMDRPYLDTSSHEPHLHKDISNNSTSQSDVYSASQDNFLHIDAIHSQQPGYDSSATTFKTGVYRTTFESSADNSYNPESSSNLDGQINASYMLEGMTDNTTYGIQDMSKSNMSMTNPFLDSERLQHLPEFRGEAHNNALYFDLHNRPEQQALQHFDHPSSQGQAQTLAAYSLDGMPASSEGQSHQTYSTDLAHAHPNSSTLYPSQSSNPVEYMGDQYSGHYYTGASLESGVAVYSQQCAIASEAPVLPSPAVLPCDIPYSSAQPDLHLEFRFSEDPGAGKQPVLPSASFSPPSVADQAALPDSSEMTMYNGTFPSLSVYEMYVKGGQSDGKVGPSDGALESGSFCVECNTTYKTQCKFHPSNYTYVADSPILSHARLTLPTCLKLNISSVVGHSNNTGVFAKEKIGVRTKFGPLIGSSVSCDKLGSTRCFSLWQTFVGNNIKVVDTSDENSANWLMFVKPARLSLEQNLIAFQHGNSVFFVTRLDIEPGQELRYWFSKDYARMLGITAKPRNARHQLCPHCTVCNTVFADRQQVRSHMRLQHPKPSNNKCTHCSRRFSKISHLKAHINSVHLRVKKFVCPTCGKRFTDSSNLRKHVKSHNEEKLFKCRLCGKDFSQKAHLQIHMNTHMPVKNEQCGRCGERFSRAFSRRQHEMQHTKQNVIQCAHCDKTFYKQRVYKEHLKIHLNVSNYTCGDCGRSFRTRTKLRRHGPSCKQRKRSSLAPVFLPPPPTSQPQQAAAPSDPLNYLPMDS
ncbi:uncharacterized protein LOC101846837 [Aplysia californica]|uniref:Uncharacterized protein LOC101846837 n=1 Tax=Aplysia californica TaxID=6500 RepID=A0ABM0K282_APLCA|nr:uncharacterized protein LOC101846837 [Aplysia californica]